MTDLIRRAIEKSGYLLQRARGRYWQDGLYSIHNDAFRRDPAFREAYARGVHASGGHDAGLEWRVHIALWAAAQALRVPGDFVECGVNAGFISSAILHRLDWNSVGRRYYLVDTFRGPVVGQFSEDEIRRGRVEAAHQAKAAGAYVTDVERVRQNFAAWPDATVVQGVVPDVLQTLDAQQVAFLHIDMNCAFPERAALEYFWDKMLPGGIVLLDDYAYFGHDAQHASMDEAASQLGASILSLPTGQGLIVR